MKTLILLLSLFNNVNIVVKCRPPGWPAVSRTRCYQRLSSVICTSKRNSVIKDSGTIPPKFATNDDIYTNYRIFGTDVIIH